jgi:hypothetical protein
MLVDLRSHGVRLGAGEHCFAREVEGVHGVESPKLQVIARSASSFSEEFVEEELHHQEGGAKVKAILTESNFRVASTDNTLLLEYLNAEPALRKQHGRGESARAGTHDDNVSLSVSALDTHRLNIWWVRREFGKTTVLTRDHLIRMQAKLSIVADQ